MTDLEAKARELLLALGDAYSADEKVDIILRHDRSVAAEARKEALLDAEKACRAVELLHVPHVPDAANAAHQCKERIRALAGRKEGT